MNVTEDRTQQGGNSLTRELTQNPLKKIWVPSSTNGLPDRHISQRKGEYGWGPDTDAGEAG